MIKALEVQEFFVKILEGLSFMRKAVFISLLGFIFLSSSFQLLAQDQVFSHFKESKYGHSWTNSYLLALVSYYSYQGGMKDKSLSDYYKKFRKKFKKWGMNKIHFVTGKTLISDTQAIVMSNDKLVIVAFRGSESTSPRKFVKDWITTDFRFIRTKVPIFGKNVEIHKGFYKALRAVYPKLLKKVRLHMKGGNKKLWVTGHSLGGALAHIAAYRLAKSSKIKVQGVHTYAAPRVGNTFWQIMYNPLLGGKTQRWVNKLDIAPMLPDDILLKYRHVGTTNNIHGKGKIKLNDKEIRGIGNPFDHDLKRYYKAIYKKLALNNKKKLPSPPK